MGVNDEVFDRQIRHYSYLERFKNREVRDALAMINRRNREIINTLRTSRREDLRNELQFLESIISESDDRIVQATISNWEEFLNREATYQFSLIDKLTPVQVSVVAPSQIQLLTAINSRPFQRHPSMAQGFREFFKYNQAQVMLTIREGYAFGVTTDQLVRNVQGITGLQGRHLETWVRSGVSHLASEARHTLYQANADIIQEEMWVSTLDTKTSPICQIMDGTTRPMGETTWSNGQTGEPGEIHWNCRSTSIPIIKDWRALGLEDPTPGERSSLDGGVPQDTTYQTWLRNQSAERQAEILGEQRAELFRSGKFDLSQMVRDGRYITLDELMAIE